MAFPLSSTSTNRDGSGLGLAVVHSLVAAHGGPVQLTSESGRTAFTIRLDGV